MVEMACTDLVFQRAHTVTSGGILVPILQPMSRIGFKSNSWPQLLEFPRVEDSKVYSRLIDFLETLVLPVGPKGS